MKTRIIALNLVCFIFLFISIFHFPTRFSKPNKSFLGISMSPKKDDISTSSLYNKLNLENLGLSEDAFSTAMKGFTYLKSNGMLHNENIITIIDFSKLSTTKRLFVIDVASGKLLFNTYVAHGQNSGFAMAEHFSNKISSLQSSLGFYKTASTYDGKNGYSLQLEGLEKGINDNAMERSIVMHGAAYVSEGMIKTKGYIGRSWGCPAVPKKYSKPIIDKIKNGSCVFIFGNNSIYLNQSKILQS